MRKITFLAIILFFYLPPANAQDSLWTRKYQIGSFNQYDLTNSSINALTTHRALHDVFRKNLKPLMNEKLGNLTYGIYSFATTYLTMLWSHEFGHSLRAKQVGGYFKIHNAGLPIPYTTMHLPDSINLVDEALSVTAGFEVNTLNIRHVQNDFIKQNGIYNEDLSFAFANRIMYPLYANVIVPRNPRDKDVWINTAGDPIHIALPVFKNYSNNRVFLPDSSVNPDLVNYYNQSNLFAVFINLIDPQFYREVGAAFGKNKTRKPIFLIGEYGKGWTYNTLFNVSPLGYELYLNNHVHLKNKKFSAYFKYGNPFKNHGAGLAWLDCIDKKRIKMSAFADFWEQDIFGSGFSGNVTADFMLFKRMGFFLNAGYKTRGYVIGKQLEEGLNVGAGMQFYTSYSRKNR